MAGQSAMIFMEHELQHILRETGKQAAQEVINAFRAELKSDPNDLIVRKLRNFLADRSTVSNPRNEWANGLHIRSIKLSARGKPKSVSWFQKFKVNTGLGDCLSRKSNTAGGNVEWCFEDIANAWDLC